MTKQAKKPRRKKTFRLTQDSSQRLAGASKRTGLTEQRLVEILIDKHADHLAKSIEQAMKADP